MHVTTRLRRAAGAIVFAAGVSACGGEDPVAPVDTSLIGVWKFVGFTDGGRMAVSGGTWVFFEEGTMAMDLTFEFPNEGRSKFAGTGTFTRIGNSVTLVMRGGKTTWDLEFTASGVTFTQTAPDPADAIISLDRF